jgi:probable rRNA maturation factor
MNYVTVTALNKRDKPWEKRLRVFGLRTLRATGLKDAALDVYVAGDAPMRVLNRQFRKKDKPTNVLSFKASGFFPRPDLRRGANYLGEIFVNPHLAQKRGEDVERLFIHSFLHLLGYTHGRSGDRMKMEKKEKWLISSLD